MPVCIFFGKRETGGDSSAFGFGIREGVSLRNGLICGHPALQDRAADRPPVVVKATIERARIERPTPHDIVRRVVSANNFDPPMVPQANDFLKADQT